MPYKEFQELKRIVSELAAIHGALGQLVARREPHETLDLSVRDNVMRLLPALKRIRDDVQAALVPNSKSWGAPSA
jgi:hypothetical protein